MKRIVVAGPRHRACEAGTHFLDPAKSSKDSQILRKIGEDLLARYGENCYVLSISCDAGFGLLIADVFYRLGIPVVEARVSIPKKFHRGERELLFLSRHAILTEMGEEFHIFRSKTSMSHIEELLQRLKGDGRKVEIYPEESE